MFIPNSFNDPRAKALSGREDLKNALQSYFQGCRDHEAREQETYDAPLEWLLPMVKQEVVRSMLIHTHGNQSMAAKALGINRGTLRKINTMKIELPS